MPNRRFACWKIVNSATTLDCHSRPPCAIVRAGGRPRQRAGVIAGEKGVGASFGGLGRLCRRSPAPGYPEEERTVADCVAVVTDEEIEHYRFAVRDLAVESR